MAAGFALEASFGQASQWLAARIATAVAQRHIQQIVAEAARDCAGCFSQRGPGPAAAGAPVAAGGEIPLVLSADGKVLAMRPEARRPSRYQHVPGAFEKRLSTGEKRGVKRMAEVGAVFGALPPQVPRTPELIMGQAPDPEGRPPAARQVRAVGRWYAADI